MYKSTNIYSKSCSKIAKQTCKFCYLIKIKKRSCLCWKNINYLNNEIIYIDILKTNDYCSFNFFKVFTLFLKKLLTFFNSINSNTFRFSIKYFRCIVYME